MRGIAVWYHQCPDCGFLFTAHFDGWSVEDWRREVYNADYGQVDPDSVTGNRARGNAGLILNANAQTPIGRMLDYGGGDGYLAAFLRDKGIDAASFDPVLDPRDPGGGFDLVTAFEVFEHTTTPVETARAASDALAPDGTLLFSTLLHDDIAAQDMSSWYIAPRNGHVSIHTRKSLARLFGDLGFTARHLSPGLHLASR